MVKLRLLIKRPGKAHAYIPVTVDSTDRIEHCVSSLVNYLGISRQDITKRGLTYSLCPLAGGQPLPSTMRFADVPILPETRLVLTLDEANAITQPFDTSIVVSDKPSHQIVSRRTFVVGSVLAGSGLFTGIATAFATRRYALPSTMTPQATPSLFVPGTLQQTLLFSSHQQTVRAVSWSPDGTMLASGADDGVLLLWTPDGQVRQQISHPNGITALAWSPTGQRLASGSGNSVRFFDGHTADSLAPIHNAHTAQISSLSWSKAVGYPLVSGSLDRRAIIWETYEYQPQAFFTHHTTAIDALACQPTSTTVASASQGGVVRLWHVDTLAELHHPYQDAQSPLRAVAFAPMGNQLTVGGDDGQVRLWSNTLSCQHPTVADQDLICTDVPLRFQAHTAPVRSVAWSPDERYLATGGEDGIFAIWASPPGTIPTLVTKTAYDDPVWAIIWSPAHRQIAVASGKTVTIWSIEIWRRAGT